VQVAVAGGVIDTELHENPSRLSAVIVTVPSVVDAVSIEPFASAASGLESCSIDERSVVELDTANDTVATTPVPMVVASGPETTQTTEPADELQFNALFAAVAAAPAVIVAEEKSAVE